MSQPPWEIAISIEPTSGNNRGIIRGALEYIAIHEDLRVYKNLAIPFLEWEKSLSWKGAGLITGVETPGSLEKIARKHSNIVSVSLHQTPNPNIATVGSDNRMIGKFAAEHLLETGLKSFAYVGFFDWYHNRLRWEGFKETIESAGFPSHKIEFGILDNGLKTTRGYHNTGHYDTREMEKALSELQPPFGLMAAHDEFADAAIEACRANNFRVPYDVAIIGVNNYRLVCEACSPPLSSIPQSSKQIGFKAASLVHDLIKGESLSNNLVMFPPAPVVRRPSTDFLAIEDEDVVEAIQFIRSHGHEKITTADVVEKVAVSRKTLDKRFMEFVGHRVAEEIKLTRLRKAKLLLSTTDMQIVAVGFNCGYESTSGFIRAFRESTGQTPLQFKRQDYQIDDR